MLTISIVDAVCQQTVSFWQAVDLWLDANEDLPRACLWGMRIVWWGRLGKIVGLLSALTIVVDIIGPARLRRAGVRMRGVTTAGMQQLASARSRVLRIDWHAAPSPLQRYVASAVAVSVGLFLFWQFAVVGGDVQGFVTRQFPSFKYSWLVSLLTLVFILIAVALIVGIGIVIGVLAAGATLIGIDLLVLGIPLVIGTVLVELGMVGSFVQKVIVNPFAWVLEHPRLELLVRSTSVVLLVVGFVFDLLAS